MLIGCVIKILLIISFYIIVTWFYLSCFNGRCSSGLESGHNSAKVTTGRGETHKHNYTIINETVMKKCDELSKKWMAADPVRRAF